MRRRDRSRRHESPGTPGHGEPDEFQAPSCSAWKALEQDVRRPTVPGWPPSAELPHGSAGSETRETCERQLESGFDQNQGIVDEGHQRCHAEKIPRSRRKATDSSHGPARQQYRGAHR
jgi:hypothetical protein